MIPEMTMLEIKASVVKEMAPPLRNAWATLLLACVSGDEKPPTPGKSGVYKLTDEQVARLKSEDRTNKGLRLFLKEYTGKNAEMSSPPPRTPTKKSPAKKD